jgi:branched-subunit amino acid aminotransferase/4-amino-4-deoxychorismate lyase
VSAMTRLRWTGAGGFERADEPGEIVVIDSWLVADGEVRAFDAHVRRFTASCAELASTRLADTRLASTGLTGTELTGTELTGTELTGTGEQAEAFMRAGLAQVPVTGRWFPRAELAMVNGTPRLQLWLRPAPPRADSIRLWIPPEPDQRTFPQIKGPDLPYLSALRDAAVAAGADEAVLLSPGGNVLEGTTTSILWWRGQALCAPPPDAPVLPGVTRAGLLASGHPVTFEYATPAELAGLKVWAVNALHGIRPVTGWATA